MTSAAIWLASSPAAAPPMPSATRNSEPFGPDDVIADLGLQAGVAGGEIGDEERVLVVLAGEAEVGLAENGDADRTRSQTGLAGGIVWSRQSRDRSETRQPHAWRKWR